MLSLLTGGMSMLSGAGGLGGLTTGTEGGPVTATATGTQTVTGGAFQVGGTQAGESSIVLVVLGILAVLLLMKGR